jgi:hypothetical protein
MRPHWPDVHSQNQNQLAAVSSLWVLGWRGIFNQIDLVSACHSFFKTPVNSPLAMRRQLN